MEIIRDEVDLANYDIEAYEFSPNRVVFILDSSIARRIRRILDLNGTPPNQAISSSFGHISEQLSLLCQFCDQCHPLE